MKVEVSDTVLEKCNPTLEEILGRVRALRPAFRERGQSCDESRKVPSENVLDLKRAGVFRMLQPKFAGGYEMDPGGFCRVVQEVDIGCASPGWIAFVLGCHNFEVPLMGPEAVKDVWGTDQDVLISSSYAPFGKANRVEGGYLVSGRWHYSSGADHGDWVFLGTSMVGADGTHDLRTFLIPRTAYSIDESSWDVMGLRGTGSKDIVVQDCFVPDHRSHTIREVASCDLRGQKTYTNPIYRYPQPVVFASSLTSAIIGMSFGMINEFRESMKVRKDVVTGNAASLNPHLCRQLGFAETTVRSCSRLINGNFGEMRALIERGEKVPMDLRVRYRSDAAFVGRQCVNAMTELFRHTGARGTLKGNSIERFMRDVQVAANHISMNMDLYCEELGFYLLTSEFKNQRL